MRGAVEEFRACLSVLKVREVRPSPLPLSPLAQGEGKTFVPRDRRKPVEALPAGEGADPTVPIISTLDGELDHPVTALADQLVKPVQFTRALQSAVEKGVTTFVTVGPGAVLRGLIRKNLGTSVKIFTTEDPNDLARTISALVHPHPDPLPKGEGESWRQ